jgi:hydroxymethylglutaryl-CoA reductase
MQTTQPLKGFSKLSREEKVNWLADTISDKDLPAFLDVFRMPDNELQSRFESFSENTLSNYHLPWGIIPNVLIDDQIYQIPVVTEESSVVAAASKASAFWAERGGFRTVFVSMFKTGQIHFLYHGDQEKLRRSWDQIEPRLKKAVGPMIESMKNRGGGILGLNLRKITGLPAIYNQVHLEIKTADSMGANLINSILEEMAKVLPDLIRKVAGNGKVEIIMAILSNHTPDCNIRMQVKAPVSSLEWNNSLSPEKFAEKMKWAADIAMHDKARAATHNKGIFNGVDAVVIATGNDFRAVEAAGHAYAVKTGKYRGLSKVILENNTFTLELEIPLAVGTVGGLTRLHPMAAKSLDILGKPNAKTLMKAAAAVGLANNFAAMASLVTTGIQKGHMKMHLKNILLSMNVNPTHYPLVQAHFSDKTVSVSAVKEFVTSLV